MLKDFPKVTCGKVHADIVREVSSFLSVFTVPALLLFVEGKEMIREARFVHVNQFREKLKRIYEGYLDS